jgi:hypothetical protein
MNGPPIILIGDVPRGWLTIPEICAWLKVSETEWDEWRAAGDTPPHITGPDGQFRVRSADLEQWLDAHTVEPENEPTAEDIAEFHAMRAESAPLAPVVPLDQARRARVERGPGRRITASRSRRGDGGR